ncbi:permease [Vibrio inusitatus NBRC 102082]|uniref:Permease n=1 Tax=Vibrio inusitatus NBRC 102082 TaxID=1219070 RepID=A0A4Y3HT71_9VIBR|nr:YoaK family protein [Vibrio inusitatus]GEA50353.1 permease [Vibrio inusitatus NBRC 102082]
MISRLPKWVEVGAFILALVAGFVNSIGLLGFEHQSVSHLSGTATLLGISVINSSFSHVLNLLAVLLSFMFGSSIAGYLLHSSTLKLGRHYDSVLFIESLFLFIALGLLSSGNFSGLYFASAACGLQNAMATTYSGAIVRTTHVTGIFTDLGIMLGKLFRGEPLDKRKAKLFIYIILGFISGGTAGVLLYAKYQFMSLLVPATACFVIAVIYKFYSRQHKPLT